MLATPGEESDKEEEGDFESTAPSLHMIQDEALIGSEGAEEVLTVDCGATGSLLSLFTLERWDQAGLVKVVGINPEVQKRYKVANGQSVLTCSQVTLGFTHHPDLGSVTFDCTETEGVPPLLGMNFLKDGVLNMARNTLTIRGKTTHLKRKGNGHLVIHLDECGTELNSIQPAALHFDLTANDTDHEDMHDAHEHDIPGLTDHSSDEHEDGKVDESESESDDDCKSHKLRTRDQQDKSSLTSDPNPFSFFTQWP
jgi:hypothetical protein